ncbi:hypothetical protein scyTo_0018422 [Scyliorhinus torazame]|uniref:Uncharacterized protein n=1 Tax=Scyliorhinus torazame TaxID=75743 RepID=A0A401PV91_SCYTO|nr:hypothetical protein [Scyliorhinus torazame]
MTETSAKMTQRHQIEIVQGIFLDILSNRTSLMTTVKRIEEEQREIDNIEKKLMEIEMKIKTCEISLFTKLKDCIDGK